VRDRRPGNFGAQYDRLLLQRSALIWAHAILCALLAVVHLGTMDLSHFAYWHQGAAMLLLLRSSGTALPYLISGIYSCRRVSHHWSGVIVFVLVLIAGTCGAAYWYIGRVSQYTGPIGTFAMEFLQIILFVSASRLCFGGGVAPPRTGSIQTRVDG
jgi:hypothetical protein